MSDFVNVTRNNNDIISTYSNNPNDQGGDEGDSGLAVQLAQIATNVKSKGAKGDSVTDDTAAFTSAVQSNSKITLPPGTYNISQLSVSGLTNVHIIGIGNPKIQGTDNTKIILDFQNCTNVRLEGFSIGYKTAPVTRTDNIEPLHFNQCTTTFVEKVEVFNSQSVGMIHVYCNHPTVRDCYVHDTLADGINFSHCGRNVKVLNNIIENAGDDSIAVYFFQSANPSLVGEPDNFTKRPVISDNIIKNGQARGVLLGGTVGAIVANNTIENTRAFGISVHHETSAVNYNTDFIIDSNNIRNPAQNGTDPNGQNDGIYVAEQNIRGSVKNNRIYNAKASGIHCLGAANIKDNVVNTAVQGMYLGDWNTTVSEGECSDNTVLNTSLEGVYVAPRSTRGWTVKGNEFINCVLPVNVGTGTGQAPAVVRTTTNGGLNVVDNIFIDAQTGQTLNSAIYIANQSGAVVEKNTLKVSNGFSKGVLVLSSTTITTPLVSAVVATQSTTQSLTANTWTKVNYQTESKDVLGEFDNTTNFRFTASVTGTYLVSATVAWATQVTGNRTLLAISKNETGTFIETMRLYDGSVGAANNSTSGGSTVISLNAGDTISIWAFTNNAVGTVTGQATSLNIVRLF